MFRSTAWAETRETSCSPEHPPNKTKIVFLSICVKTSQKSSYLVIKRDLRREKTGPALCFFGAGPGPPCFAEMIAEEAVFCKNFFVLRIS